jgi:hypothetical protein
MTTHNLLRTLLTGFFLFISITATSATEKLQAPQLVIDNTSQILLKKLKEPGFASNKTEIRSDCETMVLTVVVLSLGSSFKGK